MGGLTAPGAAVAIDDAASPCTAVCALDADDVCRGCGRTIDEIAGWAAMPLADRRAVLARLAAPYAAAAISASSIAPARR